MEVKSKFNIDEEVFYMKDNRIKYDIVDEIQINIDAHHKDENHKRKPKLPIIKYVFISHDGLVVDTRHEGSVFKTKEDVVKDLCR